MLRFGLAVLVLITGLSSAARGQEEKFALDRPFSLVDADGKTVSSTDFPGKWLLIYFGYTYCADLCPLALTAMTDALDAIGPAAQHIQPLFITVDPERDHGPDLRKFTAAFDKRLIGLTGTHEQIGATARTLGVRYEKVLRPDSNYVIDHSSTLSLIDRNGRDAVTFRMPTTYLITAKLLDTLERAGVKLDNVANRGAFR